MSTTELNTVETKEQKPEARKWRRPYYDVFESKDAFDVKVSLPGVGRDEVEVSVDGSELTIVTTRLSDPTAEWRPLRQELPKGDFRLNLRLNVLINADKIKAKVEDGILNLTLPKADDYKVRKIKIN